MSLKVVDSVMTFDATARNKPLMPSGSDGEAQVVVVDVERVEAAMKMMMRAEGTGERTVFAVEAYV